MSESDRLENRLVDRLVGDNVDWVDIVRSYPKISLTVAAMVGFLVGRAHGPALIESATDSASEAVQRAIGPQGDPYP